MQQMARMARWKRGRFGRASILIGIAIAGGCQDDPNEFQAPPPPKVTIAPPIVREVTTYAEFTGRLDAIETVELRARVRGFLETIDFEPGDNVKKGQKLFGLEQAPFQAALDAANADLESAEAARELAKITLERAQNAYEQGAVSEIEMAENRAKVSVSEAAVGVAKAAVDAATVDFEYTTITSPIDGRVSRELQDAGNLVGANEATLLTTVLRDDPIFVYFSISQRALEAYLAERPRYERRKRATTLILRLSDGSQYEHEGVVDFVDTSVDPLTGTTLARGELPNPEGRLYAGLFVRAMIPEETKERVIVPEVSVQRDLAGTFVLIVEDSAEGKLVVRRPVTLGKLIKGERIIEDGLDGSERVIVSGVQRARPGIVVDAMEAEAGANAGHGTDAHVRSSQERRMNSPLRTRASVGPEGRTERSS